MDTTQPGSDPPQHLLGGINVVIIAPAEGAPQAAPIRSALEAAGVNVTPYAVLTHADADAFDAVVVVGGQEALAQLLRKDPGIVDFLNGLCQENKPAAALGEGVSLLEAAGHGERASWLTAPADAPLEAFLLQFKQRLAQRRRASRPTGADDSPSAVGEDG